MLLDPSAGARALLLLAPGGNAEWDALEVENKRAGKQENTAIWAFCSGKAAGTRVAGPLWGWRLSPLFTGWLHWDFTGALAWLWVFGEYG